jgi:integrase
MTLLDYVRANESRSDVNFEKGNDAVWKLNVQVGKVKHNCEIVWSRYNLPINRIVTTQLILLKIWNFSSLKNPDTISSADYKRLSTLLRIMLIVEDHYPNVLFCQLEKKDWIKVSVLSVFRVWKDDQNNHRVLISSSEPLSFQMADRIMSILRIWHTLYHQGDVSDGPEFNIKTGDLTKQIKHELSKIGINYNDWKKGESYGAIEFTTAHLLLSDALEKLYSLRTKQLCAYFSSVREQSNHHLLKAFWVDHESTQLTAYRESGDIELLTNSSSGDRKNSLANAAKFEVAIPLHNRLIALLEEKEKFVFPWKNHKELLLDYNDIQAALYIIFLSVMGKRGPSEVLSLRGLDITPSDATTGQNAEIRPSILKTNKGLREAQGITNFIDDAFDVILDLSYINKENTTLPLFSALPPINKALREPTPLSISHSFVRLDRYYDSFCTRISSKVDFDIKELHSKISSHQFRHSFAEFGLRKFDGNVEELIRQHFCHKYNHWWTKRYTEDKLDADYENNLSRAYIKELIPRILLDSHLDPDFVGGMALFIKKELGTKIKSIEPAEAEYYINEISNSILQITPHEYGWCLVHEKYRGFAQCADENGNPNPSSTNSSKCNACANFCASKKSHLAIQTQLAISHIDFIESDVWKMPNLKQASIAAVQNAQILFPELKSLGSML